MDSGKRILVVDDFSTMRRIVSKLLKNLGFENITEAEDGSDALQKLKENKFDLILSDCNMPNMCGLELLQNLKKDPVLKDIPFIVMTAKEQEGNMIEMAMAGMNDYVVKPFSSEVLQEKLQNFL